MDHKKVLILFLSFFGLGKLPKAPGTWGSLGAIPLYLILNTYFSFKIYVSFIIILFLGGWLGSYSYLKHYSQSNLDPQEIVIDEVIGQLIAFLPLWYLKDSSLIFLKIYENIGFKVLLAMGIVSGFILFRIFDIFKPWPVSWADNFSHNFSKIKSQSNKFYLKTSLGIILDDVIAGIYSAVFFRLYF